MSYTPSITSKNKCQKCNGKFLEIQDSHDVPTYLFDGDIKQRMINFAIQFAKRWFKK